MNKFIRQASDSNKTDRQTDILKVCWENYYTQFVCHRCVFVCPRAYLAEPIFTKFVCRSPVAVARSSSGGIAIPGAESDVYIHKQVYIHSLV